MSLIGENGAGKSTLVKILAGLVTADSGTVAINGAPCDIGSPARSRDAGIAVVQQELSLVPSLTAVENVFLGSALGGVWSASRLRRLAAPHLEAVGLASRDWLLPVEQLSVAEQQLIEIARLMARDAQILIFDEPTAALSDAEIQRVLDVVRHLTAAGRGVIYVTHRLREVFQLGGRVTVIRGGLSQPPIDVCQSDVSDLVERMLGQSLASMYPPRAAELGEPVLELAALSTPSLAAPIDLSVRRGEIVGLVGQIGSGGPSVLHAMAGRVPYEGRVVLDGAVKRSRSVHEALAHGIAYCSADRKKDGLFQSRSVRQNLTAPALERLSRFSWYSPSRAAVLAWQLASQFQIRLDRMRMPVASLSGGNQQKVALGKWLSIDPRVLLVEEPTRGVDIGARAEIYRHLRALAEQGMVIVFASSDLSEALGLSDTVVTLYRGRVVRSAPAAKLTESDVMVDVTHGPGDLAA